MLVHTQLIQIITGGIITVITTTVIETIKVVIIADDLDILLEIVGKEIILETKIIMATTDITRLTDLTLGLLAIVATKRDIFPEIVITHQGDLAHIAINLDIGDMYVQLGMSITLLEILEEMSIRQLVLTPDNRLHYHKRLQCITQVLLHYHKLP